MATTSAELIAEKVTETRAALLRHAEAIDSKAGVILGFAGAFVILSFSDFSWWRLPAIALATASAFSCLTVFRPGRVPGFELRPLRDDYLTADAPFTQRHLIDTEIEIIDFHSLIVSANARWLRAAIVLLVLGIVATTMGTLIDQIGG